MSIYEEYGELIVQQEILQAQVNAVRIKINTDIERKENEKEAKKESRSQENKKSVIEYGKSLREDRNK